MNALLVAARAVHFASVMLLFGEFVFVLAVARPAWRDADGAASAGDQAVHRHLFVVASWSLVVSVASGAAWLAAEAAAMSGLPITSALRPDTLGLVLAKTVFGRVWVLRFVLVIALGLLLLAMGRSTKHKRSARLAVGALLLATLYLATLAWAGHAAAGQGSERFVQIVSDVVHLLAAGAWVGALPGLVFLLGSARALDAAAQATRRFSTVGMLSVSALILSGLINAWFLVGDVPALIGTDYGRLLLAKLTLVVLMVSLAAVNRVNLTPRLQGRDREARRLLRRNAILETAAGIAVVAIVGALGVTIPGAHQPPLWPFGYTLSWQPAQDSAVVGAALAAAGALACIAAGVGLRGAWTRQRNLWIVALFGIGATVAACAWLLAVPAYPTTYVRSPERYTTAAIVSGSALYARSCSTCHGLNGYGDSPAAPSMSINPANLVEHATRHPAGDLFWWIAHGIPGTPMPGFSSHMSDVEIWDLIQFLDALSEAEDARSMTGGVEPWRFVVAPDFTFELPRHAQESLNQQRGNYVTLVLYTVPQSLPRLHALAAKKQVLADAGVRVIAVPISTSATAVDTQTMKGDEPMFAIARPDVATAYAMFARRSMDSQDAAPTHVEFLIDRQGYLRARWIGIADAATDQTAEMLRQVELLNREQARASAVDGHAH